MIKLLLIGDSGVGKSALIMRFSEERFESNFVPTLGIDFKIKMVTLDEKKIKLQIWDTAGQERFRTITTAYYRGAQGILLCYDITSRESFDAVRTWVRNIELNASETVVKLLVANKCDLEESRKVSKEDGEKLAKEFNMDFIETSALANSNVSDAFGRLTAVIKTKMDKDDDYMEKAAAGGAAQKDGGVDLTKDAVGGGKRGCKCSSK